MASSAKLQKKDVKYLGRDFSAFRSNLIEFAKTYFPNTYNDFNESDPGMMFIEMASYVGDVLSYYVDDRFKESLLSYAEELDNVFEIAQSLGYKPKLATPSSTIVDVFQTVPATGTGDDTAPDMRYAMSINAGMQVKSRNGIVFRSEEDVNFAYSSSLDKRSVSIYETSANVPTKYLLKKSVSVLSGTITSEEFTFGNAKKYDRIALGKPNVTDIISVTDSDGNKWYEVDFLAKDIVFDDVSNSSTSDPELSQYSDDTPYLIKLIKTPRRFTRYIRSDDKTELRFGAGISAGADEDIVPNPDNVGSSLPGGVSMLDKTFDPSNFLKTKAYGLSPADITLTIKYAHGGGVGHNVGEGSITEIKEVATNLDPLGLDSATVTATKSSVGVINPNPARGGKSKETLIEIRQNALAHFTAQSRAVTKEDYIMRAYSMPAKYGAVAKAYIVPDEQLEGSQYQFQRELGNGSGIFTIDRELYGQDDTPETGAPKVPTRIPNPLALNMYLLGYDYNKHLTSLNRAVKENLKNYLGQYRMVTDAINLKDCWIVNIGVDFKIMTKKGYNKEEVLLKCIQVVKDFFNIDNWQINQPIVVSELSYALSLVDGVATLVPFSVDLDGDGPGDPIQLPVMLRNKWRTTDGYSGNIYDMGAAYKEGIYYPSLDPCMFELKYPDSDIKGQVIGSIT
tara:strand:- start:14853 stop:16889 length:2037 start_codon:yes stop_codon:yes gene_type:complete